MAEPAWIEPAADRITEGNERVAAERERCALLAGRTDPGLADLIRRGVPSGTPATVAEFEDTQRG